jgi:hypothetical protein
MKPDEALNGADKKVTETSKSNVKRRNTMPSISCKHRVKPFPFEWCVGCMLNGCYPWNRNPMLLCSLMGGILPTVIEKDEQDKPVCCDSCKPVTSDLWEGHLAELKRDAESNEDIRLRAMRGKAYSSERLPAEIGSRLMKRNRKSAEPDPSPAA